MSGPATNLMLKYRRAAVVTLHGVMVLGAYYLAFLLRFNGAIDAAAFQVFLRSAPLLVAVRLLTFVPFRLYRGLWRYIGIRDLQNIIYGTIVSEVIFYGAAPRIEQGVACPRSVYLIDSLLVIFLLGGMRLARRVYRELGVLEAGRRVLIFGAGDAGEMIVRDMINNPFYNLEPVGFVDDDPVKWGRRIHNVPILGPRLALPRIIERTRPDEILIAVTRVEPRLLRGILKAIEPYRLPVKTLPNLRDVLDGRLTIGRLRKVSPEDLLQRGAVGLDAQPLKALLCGRRVLVTGAAGSIGSELCRQIAALGAENLVLFERSETALYTIENELRDRGFSHKAVAIPGDVTDSRRVHDVFAEYRPEVVFHAAAYKHVPLMEAHPREAVKNNVTGTRIVAEAADRHRAARFTLISTDKAVSPSSVMGVTKRVAETIVREMSERSPTCFSIVRFGNVLGSNGSVVPRFLEQIGAGGPVTVTHPEMRRFFMTIPEAVNLVLHSATLEERGAIYTLDMGEQIRILDMARHLIQLSGFVPGDEIAIEFTGLRPGEKLYEELLDEGETAVPSGIKQILHVNAAPLPDREILVRQLAALEMLTQRGQTAELVDALAKLVPTFHRAGTGPIDDQEQLIAAA